ncbi:MAG: hypothetical protein RL300_606 [Pseudomonadota bacterium]
MPKKWGRFFIGLASLTFLHLTTQAQVFAIPPLESGLFSSSKPTMTLLFANPKAKATLVFIPGGEAHRGLTPETNDVRNPFDRMLKSLADPSITAGNFNVVFFDSPSPMVDTTMFPVSRTRPDHLSRIHSTVQFFYEKLQKPVWLMGHSRGGTSVTEYYKYLQNKGQASLVSGLIYSAGSDGSSLGDKTPIPVLLLLHEKDGCRTPAATQKIFDDLREQGNDKTAFSIIKTGISAAGDPCRSGYHMYLGAQEEVTGIIDSFVAQHIQD